MARDPVKHLRDVATRTPPPDRIVAHTKPTGAPARRAVGTLAGICGVLLGTATAENPSGTTDSVRALLGLRPTTLATLFVEPPDATVLAGLETFLDDESRCDGAPGCVESIDTLYEALSLATHLFAYGDERLLEPIHESDLVLHGTLQDPPPVEKDSALVQLRAVERGDQLRRNVEAFRASFWSTHLQTNRAHLRASLDAFANLRPAPSGERTVLLLGAGSCADIPLEDLVRRFRVVLVDLDLPSMEVARSGLPTHDATRLTLEVRDLSGGIALRHASEFARIIRESSSSAAALDPLAAFMENAVVPTPLLEGRHRADVLVSSMLVSQIPFYLLMQIIENLDDPSLGLEGRGWPPRFEAAYRRYAAAIQAAHAEALRDFCIRTGGLVYYSSDLGLRRSVLEFGTTLDPVPELRGFEIPSLWMAGTAVRDLAVFFQAEEPLRILERFEPWIWEHQHPVLQERWSSVRTADLCAPLRADSCWTAGPQRFKYGRRFVVGALAFTRR